MNKTQLLSIMLGLDARASIIADYLEDYETTEEALEAWYQSLTTNELDEDQQKIVALMEVADLDWNEADMAIDEYDYYVYTEEQADEAFEEAIDNYIDDCVLSEIPPQYRNYFDRDVFMKDCLMDGRGILASYDNEEKYTTILDTKYYIYRCN